MTTSSPTQPESFSREEQRRIIKDILRWKLELEIPNRKFTHDDLHRYTSRLFTLSSEELETWWYDHVGEWVASRGDLEIPDGVDCETFIDTQFNRLIDGEETAYGFIEDVRWLPVKTSSDDDPAPTVYLKDGTPVKVRMVGKECEGDISGEGHFAFRHTSTPKEEPVVYFEEIKDNA